MATGPRHRRSRPAATYLVSTHLSEKLGELVTRKLERQQVTLAFYLRQLILRDLGVVEDTTKKESP